MAIPHLNIWLVIFHFAFKSVWSFGIGKTSGLYGPNDRGIFNLEAGNFSSTIVGSNTAWVVEFYSSYCGHCINFAPHFKEFASQVADWNFVIKVGAIDCAQDVNMPVCREYEIMGYPTLKFFPVNSHKNEYGTTRASYSKEVKDIISDMLDYLQKMEGNQTLTPLMENWPKLEPTSALTSQELWASTDDDTRFIILVFEENQQSLYGKLLVMDVSARIKDLNVPIILRRSIGGSDAGQSLLENLGLSSNRHFPLVVSLERKNPENKEVLWPGGEILRFDLSRVVNDFIWKNTKSLSGSYVERGRKKEQLVTNPEPSKISEKAQVTKKPDVTRRRYSLFLADLENTLLYALTHEIAQRAVISDKSLAALHKFVDVLLNYFPSRPKTQKFLQELRTFVRSHDDIIRGEDLQDKLTELRLETDSFSDLSKEWIGCRGSKPIYGGFPCGLWSLWHALTVAHHESGSSEPKEVLNAMVSYIEEFFSCRECARHFLLEADQGKNIEREVDSTKMSVLWLWRTHNRVNQRLSGDLTDDPAFPKEIFPNKQHCAECYNTQILGSDLWTEFDHDQVLKFITNLYSSNNLNKEGLRGGLLLSNSLKRSNLNDPTVLEQSDKANYSERNNQAWGFAFSPVDISLCFGIYILSALILIVVYLKFIARKRFGQMFSSLKVFGKRRSSGSPHIQIGKV